MLPLLLKKARLLSEFLLGGMFLFQVILLVGNGEVFFNELIATIGEVRWPDAVFKASEIPHLVTSNVISLVLLHICYQSAFL